MTEVDESYLEYASGGYGAMFYGQAYLGDAEADLNYDSERPTSPNIQKEYVGGNIGLNI